LATVNSISVYINGGERALTLANAFESGEWTHVAFTYNKDAGGTDEIKIYVNGAQNITGDYSVAIGTDSQDVRIASFKSSGNEFTGQIDDVRIYNRTLSAEEITKLYNLGR